jgi:hypothetical protein
LVPARDEIRKYRQLFGGKRLLWQGKADSALIFFLKFQASPNSNADEALLTRQTVNVRAAIEVNFKLH